MRHIPTFGFFLAATALGGCGNGGPSLPAAPVERGIFISSSDCAASEKLTFEQCGQLIDNAVALHQNLAPSYPSLDGCTKSEGGDRCAKGFDGRYHPNIEAFLITFGQQPSALPLYGTSDGSVGFKGLDKKKYGLSDGSYTASDSAQALANENARLGKG